MLKRFLETIGVIALLFTALVLLSALIFSIIEDRSLVDSIYYVITVITTVGFGDITPQTLPGKIHFIITVFIGFTLFAYFISKLSTLISEDRLMRLFSFLPEYFRLVGALKNHVIIIGWNEYARNAYRELKEKGVDAVVVVDDEELARKLTLEGFEAVYGDLDNEELYKNLNFKGAKGIIVVGEDGSEAIIDVLKIRKHVADTPITVLTSSSELEDIYRQAGAKLVINIAEVGGKLLAKSMLEPRATEVEVDILRKGGLTIGEYRVSNRLVESRVGDLKDIIESEVIALAKKDRLIVKPRESEEIEKGDKLIILGDSEVVKKDIEELRKRD